MSHFSQIQLTTTMIALCLSTTLCLSTSRALGQENPTEGANDLLPADPRTCVFANEKTLFGYSSQNAAARDIKNWHVDWSLMAGSRTITRGSSKAILRKGSEKPLFHAEIATPPLRDGVVLPAQLQMTWTSGKEKVHHNRPLFIFSHNPFPSQQAFLEEAQIKLFDADGKTAELLDDNEIPHSRLLNLSSIDQVTEGIVIVGEGVSFREQRKLAESLFQAAQRGVPVLCLAPSEGNFSLPIDEHGQKNQPIRFLLEREDFVRKYDKRFDTITGVSNLSLTSLRDEVVISVNNGSNDGPKGWSLLNLEFPSREPNAAGRKPNADGGKLMVCCLGIVTHWETSPVPRYLLIRLLEELTTPSENAGRVLPANHANRRG